MTKRLVSFRSSLVLLAAVMFTAGCDQSSTSSRDMARPAASRAATLASYGELEGVALRVRTDSARGRVWVLDDGQVRVYNAANRRLIRRIALPDWFVSSGACEPDLVLDRSGSAFISSNVVTTLWRVDGDTLRVRQHDVSLWDEWKHRDVGFGALAFGHDGALYALTSSWGAVWKIDLAAGAAKPIHASVPPAPECAFTPGFLRDFETAKKPWTQEPFVAWRG
ncbi:MAG TPA: hypothetical protein VG106_04185 [Vicinamibacterales bacterium]|nr:hypothetical protein [Vicinamibacterales bacterium]